MTRPCFRLWNESALKIRSTHVSSVQYDGVSISKKKLKPTKKVHEHIFRNGCLHRSQFRSGSGPRGIRRPRRRLPDDETVEDEDFGRNRHRSRGLDVMLTLSLSLTFCHNGGYARPRDDKQWYRSRERRRRPRRQR